jgi:hypothetical protein
MAASTIIMQAPTPTPTPIPIDAPGDRPIPDELLSAESAFAGDEEEEVVDEEDEDGENVMVMDVAVGMVWVDKVAAAVV